MRALVFEHDVLRYLATRTVHRLAPPWWSARWAPLHLRELPVPEPRAPGWARVRVRLSGVCGTDVRLVTGEDSLSLEPEATYPFVPGHEIVAELVEPRAVSPRNAAGVDDWDGRRVAVWPVLGCATREQDEPCEPCRAQWDGLCERRGATWPGAACSIGFSRETGGGWAEACLAHRSQLWALPHRVSDEDAVLLDPAAAALAALLRTSEQGGRTTLVIGGGTIGLLVARLHAVLGLPGTCELLVRHEFQREWAITRGFEAALARDAGEFHAWATARGIPHRRVPPNGHVYRGVYDRVIDCAGTSMSLTWALGTVRSAGQIVLVTAPAALHGLDPTPLWFRELRCRGIYQYGPVPWDGAARHPYEVLLPLLASGALRLADLVTHRFGLDRYEAALEAAVHRGRSRAIKVVFDPGRP